mmetsp:Transcript_22760/g.51946  ORF Transcript_22760/g.51946 Transcript_22760/m.51946 type:complete len:237 (-) Transcript_22760:1240-1950(-)
MQGHRHTSPRHPQVAHKWILMPSQTVPSGAQQFQMESTPIDRRCISSALWQRSLSSAQTEYTLLSVRLANYGTESSQGRCRTSSVVSSPPPERGPRKATWMHRRCTFQMELQPPMEDQLPAHMAKQVPAEEAQRSRTCGLASEILFGMAKPVQMKASWQELMDLCHKPYQPYELQSTGRSPESLLRHSPHHLQGLQPQVLAWSVLEPRWDGPLASVVALHSLPHDLMDLASRKASS